MFADGTSGSERYRGYISYNHNADVLEFAAGAATYAYLNASGNFGIGTSSVSRRLHVSDSGSIPARIESTSTDSQLEFVTSGGTTALGGFNGNMVFIAGASERMRVDSSGNLLVGTTSTPTGSTGGSAFITESVGRKTLKIASTTTSGAGLAEFINPNGVVGTIVTNGSATAYNTSSDQRLKDNIVDAPSASDDIDAIQVRSFDWKADGSHQKYGMVAQELQSVAPEAVTGDADSDDMMGVDYSKLVPMMLKEIQSLRARVAQLEGEN